MPTFTESENLVKERILWMRKWSESIPNYVHSIRVCEALKKHGFNEVIQMGWLLHDIVEDGDTSFEELKGLWYSEEVVHLVDLSSHDISCEEGLQRRKDMVRRLVSEENIDARAIKLADISDNLQECHMMQRKSIACFLNLKCPVFVYYGNKYFWGTEFYNEFLERYFKQVKDFHEYLS